MKNIPIKKKNTSDQLVLRLRILQEKYENGSSSAKDTLKEEILNVLKYESIKEFSKIKDFLKYVDINEIDNLIFDKNSNFLRSYKKFKNEAESYVSRRFNDFFHELDKLE